MRHVSWRRSFLRIVLITPRALYGSAVVPEDVSWIGFKGTLKSPPSMRVPSWKVVRASATALKNVT